MITSISTYYASYGVWWDMITKLIKTPHKGRMLYIELINTREDIKSQQQTLYHHKWLTRFNPTQTGVAYPLNSTTHGTTGIDIRPIDCTRTCLLSSSYWTHWVNSLNQTWVAGRFHYNKEDDGNHPFLCICWRGHSDIKSTCLLRPSPITSRRWDAQDNLTHGVRTW